MARRAFNIQILFDSSSVNPGANLMRAPSKAIPAARKTNERIYPKQLLP